MHRRDQQDFALALPARRARRTTRAALDAPVRSETHRPTSDDWSPNFPDGTVQVSLLELSDGQWRVCVWGADDTGMERDFAQGERQAAERLNERLTGCSDVTRALCVELGMVNA